MNRYVSTKNFDNFSVALRQWRAQHSHCCLLHGYSFEIKVWFASTEADINKQLDDMNWIVDYGGFKKPPHGNGRVGNPSASKASLMIMTSSLSVNTPSTSVGYPFGSL